LVSPDSQVELTEAVVHLKTPAEVKQLEPIGKIVSVQTFSEDKFPRPKATILGAESPIEIGESIDLAVEDTIPPGVIQAQYSWGVFQGNRQKKAKVWPDQKSVYFGAGIYPTEYNVILIISYLYNVNGELALRQSDIIATTVKVVSSQPIPPTPNPPVPPTPPTPPAPVIPDGNFGLTKKAYNLFAQSPKPLRDALIESYNNYKDERPVALTDILGKVLAENRKSIAKYGIDLASAQKFISPMDDELFNLYNSGKIKTPLDYINCQAAIVDGLKLLP
jgi:hypothetical protein